MTLACALVPDFPVAFARLRTPELRVEALVVVDRPGGSGRVLALDPEAGRLGARVGMTAAQAAAAACVTRQVLHDAPAARDLWERALERLEWASPLVADRGEGTAVLEMRGIPGGSRRWFASIREAFADDPDLAALPLRVALGPNPFVAGAAAAVRDGTIVEEAAAAAFLAPLPLAVLGLPPALEERLALLGIATLGALAALPHGPFVRRFGPAAAGWHALAQGIDERPFVPRPRRLRIERARFGEGAAEREEQLLFALRGLVAELAGDLAAAGMRAGALGLELECEDGACVALPVAVAQPTAAAETLFDLVRARLETTTLAAPVVGLRLRAERLEAGGGERSLFAAGDPEPERVAVALARLEASDAGAALRARVVPAHRPEARAHYEPFSARGLERRPGAPRAATNDPHATLVYRVLEPRAIEVRLRAGLPAQVEGRAVLEVAGPWRVDEAWWAEALDSARRPLAHDAFDVLLEDGRLCRIVREGTRWSLAGCYD
ncbi:MAG: hypothetical protein ACREM2_12195 [Vulcanimicrobiaceae bacterium]